MNGANGIIAYCCADSPPDRVRSAGASPGVRHLNLIAMLAMEYMVALLLAWSSVIAMFSADARRLQLPLALRIAPFAVLIAGSLAVRVTRRLASPEHPPVGDTTPDASWIFGQLYVNRADSALFVQKRMGLGYTLNFGHRLSWLVVLVGILAVSVTLLFVG